MMPMCSSRRSPRPFTAGIPPILERRAQSAVSTPELGGDWPARSHRCGPACKGPGTRGTGTEGRAGRAEGQEVPTPGTQAWGAPIHS